MLGAKELGTAVIKFIADPKQFTSGMNKMASKLDGFANKAQKVGADLSNIGRQGMMLGAALAAPFVLGVKKAIEFESAFSEVTTLLGDVTDAELKDLENGVLDMAAAMGQDAVTATNALYQAVSASVPKENIISFLEVAGKAAIGGLTDVETSVDTLSTVVNSFGEDLSQWGDYTERATHVSDVLFQTIKGGKTTFTELAQNVGNVASTASAAGVSLEELAAGYATLTKNGVNTAASTTALMQTFMSLLKVTPDAREEFERLEIDLEGFQKGSVSFIDILKQIAEKTGGTAIAMSKLTPNTRALKGALILARDGGKMFEDELKKIHKATGAADEAFKIMAKTVKQQLKVAWQTLNVSLIKTGQVILPEIIEQLKKIQPHLDKLVEYAKKDPDAFKEQILGWAKAVGIFLVSMTSLFVVGKVITIIAGVTKAIAMLVIGLKVLVITLYAVNTAANAAAWGMGTIVASVGIGAVGLGVAFAAIAAGIASIFVSAVYTGKVQHDLKKSTEELGDANDVYLKSLVKAKTITQEQADAITALDDVEKEHEATLALNQEVKVKRNAEDIEMLKNRIMLETGVAATSEQIEMGRRAQLFLFNDAKAAALAVSSGLDEAGIAELQRMTDAEREQYVTRLFDQTSFNAESDALRDIDKLKDAEDHAEKLANWGLYKEGIAELYGELVAERERLLKEYKRQLAEEGDVTKETFLSIQNNAESLKVVSGELRKAETGDIAARIEAKKEIANLSSELAVAELEASDVVGRAYMFTAATGREATERIIQSNLYLEKSYNELHDEQKTKLGQMVYNLADMGENADSITSTMPELLRRAAALPVDETTEKVGKIKEQYEGLTDSAHEMGEGIHEGIMKGTPEAKGSPSFMEVWARSVIDYGGMLWTMVDNTGSAATAMHGIWTKFADYVAGIFQFVKDSMNKMNPWARFSPSLIDNMTSGARKIVQIAYQQAKDLDKIYTNTYRNQQKKMKAFYGVNHDATMSPAQQMEAEFAMMQARMVAKQRMIAQKVTLMNTSTGAGDVPTPHDDWGQQRTPMSPTTPGLAGNVTVQLNVAQVRSDDQIRQLANAAVSAAERTTWRNNR